MVERIKMSQKKAWICIEREHHSSSKLNVSNLKVFILLETSRQQKSTGWNISSFVIMYYLTLSSLYYFL